MSNVQRVGDTDSGGGSIAQGISSVRVNGIPIAVSNMPVTSHPRHYPHSGGTMTQATQSSVRAAGIPVVKEGDHDTCGHTRVGGSPDVKVG